MFTTDLSAQQGAVNRSVANMTRLLKRRGPDAHGNWCSPDQRVQFGFRRLAIIDLSEAGHQPMVSGDGSSALVFNGEVYNFLELRRELEGRGIAFRSRTDSEVVLEALNLWGADAIERFNGMFALAWYSLKTHELVLARDHAGIKPLYYYLDPKRQGIAFASQYNCLLHNPWSKPDKLRPDVLQLYLRLHHMPPPFALFEHTYQLEPGHYLLVRPDGTTDKRSWWTLPRHPETYLSAAEAVDALDAVFDNVVRRQRIADVPLGVFLSGGIDSPLVTSVARKQTGPNLRAFTIGNPGWWQDESEIAAGYAKHLDVDFRLHNVEGLDSAKMLQDVAVAQTEPFGDFSIFPTLLVSQAARTELTVALSGDGGDELFWGYERPLSLLRNGRDFRWPFIVRYGLYAAGKVGLIGQRSGAIVSRTVGDYYFGVNSRISAQQLHQIAPSLNGLPTDFTLYDFDKFKSWDDLAHYSRWVEFYGQLQRGLKKVDMASMYHNLEVRVPLLDRDIIDLSLKVRPAEGMRNGTRKYVLRQLLAQYVPADIIPTKKLGFSVPLSDWLRKQLRPAVHDLLLDGDLYPHGLFDRQALSAYCEEHFAGRADHRWGIWTLMALQLWYREHYQKDVS